MIDNFNKIIETKSFEQIKSLTVIRNKTFSDETIRSHDLMGLTYANLTFSNCNLIDLALNVTLFLSCNFINCNFTNVIFAGGEFDCCNFKNCIIVKSNLLKTEIKKSDFIDCKFDDVLLTGLTFTECKLVGPKFHDTKNLSRVTLVDSIVSNSNKCIAASWGSDLSKVLNDLKE